MPAITPSSLSAGILAGGRSTRMGRDKAFLPMPPDGAPLISRQAKLLSQVGCDELLISGRPGVAYRVPGARVVTDPVPASGPLAGLVALLSAARNPWVLVIAVDLPHLTASYLEKLLAASQGTTGIVPLGPNGFEPLVGLYPKKILPLIERALAEGRLSLQPLLHAAVAEGSLRALVIEAAEHPLFANWNTPGDVGNG
jgi:molybdopterin-guanine dinucleotide biosynthesis protein A